MVGYENTSRILRKQLFVSDFEFYVEVAQHTIAEVGTAERKITLEQSVELILTYKPLNPPHKETGHKTSPAAQAGRQHLLYIYLYRFIDRHNSDCKIRKFRPNYYPLFIKFVIL